MVKYMYIALGQGQNNPQCQDFFLIIKIQSICQLTASFALQMNLNNFPPLQYIGDLS